MWQEVIIVCLQSDHVLTLENNRYMVTWRLQPWNHYMWRFTEERAKNELNEITSQNICFRERRHSGATFFTKQMTHSTRQVAELSRVVDVFVIYFISAAFMLRVMLAGSVLLPLSVTADNLSRIAFTCFSSPPIAAAFRWAGQQKAARWHGNVTPVGQWQQLGRSTGAHSTARRTHLYS